MAAFTFTSPDGKNYTVQGPDGATSDQAFAILQQQLKGQQAAYSPVEGMSTAGKLAAGFGQRLVQANDAARQALLPKTVYDPESGQDIQTGSTADADIAEHRQLDKPLNATTAGRLGNMAGSVAIASAVPIAGLPGAAAGGALEGLTQPTLGDESRAANTALGAAGGAAGYGIGKVAGRLLQPLSDSLSAAGRWARDILGKEGVPLDVAQATGSKAATVLKNAAGDSPLVGGSTFPEAQAKAFTKASLAKMGVNGAEDAGPAVMVQGKRALQQTYDEIAARNPIKVDEPLVANLETIRADAASSLTAEHAKVIGNKIDQTLAQAQAQGGTIPGLLYQKIQSSLGQLGKDGGKAPFITQLRQALTGAMERQASPQDVQLLAQTNQQYAAMKAIQKAIGDDNQVSPAKLFNALDTQRGANGTVYGQGANQPLIQLAQAGKLLIGKNFPNSGTTARAAGLAAATSGGAALYALATGDTKRAEELAGLAVAAGFSGTAARALVYSPAGRQWLTRWAQSRLASGAASGVATAAGRIGAAIPSAAGASQ